MGIRMGLVVLSVKTGIKSGKVILKIAKTSGRQFVFAVVVRASSKNNKSYPFHPGRRAFSIIREWQLSI